MSINRTGQLSSHEEARVLGALDAAVLVLETDRRVRYFNAAAENLLRISTGHGVGLKLANLCQTLESEENLDQILDDSERMGGSITRYALTLCVFDGSRVLVDMIASIDPLLGWIIEFRPVESSLQHAEEEAQEKIFNAAQDMIRGLAHEIKNPLGGLRGAAQLLEQELDTEELREYTQIIIHEVDRLRRLVDRLQGPNTRPQPRPVNIHQVIEHVRRLQLADLPTDVAVRFDYDLSIPDLHADPEQLVQVFLNLLRNAQQAMMGHGKIIVRTRVERFVTLQQQLHRLGIRVDIIDDGPGIAPDLLPRIFLPLVTSRADGMGMGLAIVQNMVRAHGGTVQCRSEPGQTVFSVRLPLPQQRNVP